MFLALINPILSSNSNWKFRLELKTPNMRGSRPYFKESMIESPMVGEGACQLHSDSYKFTDRFCGN